MAVFIYQPTSGTRVFASNETPEMLLFRWRNGSNHVVGGTHLVLRPSGSRDGRNVARQLAGSIVGICGGVAWDSQGFVEIVTTRVGAKLLFDRAEELATAAAMLGYKDFGFAENLGAQLFIAGIAGLDDGKGFRVWGEPVPGDPVTMTETAWEISSKFGPTGIESIGRRLRIRTSAGDVTVPESWVDEPVLWSQSFVIPDRPVDPGFPINPPTVDHLYENSVEDT